MTGLLRQLNILLTSRYHASVLSMEHAIPIVAVSIDARLNGIMNEIGLAQHYLHHATDEHLEEHIMASLEMAGEHEQEIGNTIRQHLNIYKNKTEAMSRYFAKWLKEQF
jgi:polysaccharide pyruvyl transferase WcaK-like protein